MIHFPSYIALSSLSRDALRSINGYSGKFSSFGFAGKAKGACPICTEFKVYFAMPFCELVMKFFLGGLHHISQMIQFTSISIRLPLCFVNAYGSNFRLVDGFSDED